MNLTVGNALLPTLELGEPMVELGLLRRDPLVRPERVGLTLLQVAVDLLPQADRLLLCLQLGFAAHGLRFAPSVFDQLVSRSARRSQARSAAEGEGHRRGHGTGDEADEDADDDQPCSCSPLGRLSHGGCHGAPSAVTPARAHCANRTAANGGCRAARDTYLTRSRASREPLRASIGSKCSGQLFSVDSEMRRMQAKRRMQPSYPTPGQGSSATALAKTPSSEPSEKPRRRRARAARAGSPSDAACTQRARGFRLERGQCPLRDRRGDPLGREVAPDPLVAVAAGRRGATPATRA